LAIMTNFIKRIWRRASGSSCSEDEDGQSPTPPRVPTTNPADEYYEPTILGESVILNHEELIYLDKMKPENLTGSRWMLVYTTDKHGFSLTTLYRNIKNWSDSKPEIDRKPLLLVIRDQNQNRFGAFVTEPFKPDYNFHGGGDCFVFRLKHDEFHQKYKSVPEEATGNDVMTGSQLSEDFVMVDSDGQEAVGEDTATSEDDEDMASSAAASGGEEDNCENAKTTEPPVTINMELTTSGGVIVDDSAAVAAARARIAAVERNEVQLENDNHMYECDFSKHHVWRWTTRGHSCFVYGMSDYLHIGLYNSSMSLWVDQCLLKGCSERTPVFDNEPLAPNPQGLLRPFYILDVEVWGFMQ